MSHVLKQRTESKVEYKDGAFIESYHAGSVSSLLKENCPNSYLWDYDLGTYTETWELYTDELEKYLKELKKEPLKNQILISNGKFSITVEYMINLIENLLRIQRQNQFNLQYPDLVILDWI